MYLPKKIKKMARSYFPGNLLGRLIGHFGGLRSLIYLGNQVSCPICKKDFRKFLPFGVNRRPNALCPRCGSLERHRLLWLYLRDRTSLFEKRLKVLHFAPEYCLQKELRSMTNLDYLSSDLDSPFSMMKMDITNISFGDNSFDAVLCIHVLEHVRKDEKAMRELFRVLRPGGWAIIQSPIDPTRERTFEDPAIVSPRDRERYFGMADHVRIYGLDYESRLKKAGFVVLADGFGKDLKDEIVEKYGLGAVEDIYYCIKPSPNQLSASKGARE